MLAKNLFATKTFQGATIGFIGCISPILIGCAYSKHLPTEKETIAIVGALITYAWAVIGRSQNIPTYTPYYLPGANKTDFITTPKPKEKDPNA